MSAIIGASAALAPPSIADELTTAPADIRLIADELTTAPVPAEDEPAVVRNIVFPVAGEPSFWDDWHAPRDNGERLHLGNDIAAPKLTPALAAVDGRVSRLSSDSEGRAGNYLVITDGEGWEYVYIHLNNDSPDTDNNINPQRWAIAPGIDVGTDVRAGRVIGFVGDSGNAETTEPHLHFEIRDPEGNHVDPHASLVKAWSDVGSRRCLRPSTAANMPSVPNSHPRLVVAATGQVVSLDGALHFGDLLTFELDAPIVAATLTRSGRGYWLLGADGGVFSFGDAAFHGSLRSFEGDPLNLLGPPESLEFDGEIRAVDIVATADGSGYWIVLASGTAIEFGGELRTLSPPESSELSARRSNLSHERSGSSASHLDRACGCSARTEASLPSPERNIWGHYPRSALPRHPRLRCW